MSETNLGDVQPTSMETEKPVSAAPNVEFPLFPGTFTYACTLVWYLYPAHLIHKYLPGLIAIFQSISEPVDADFDEDLPQNEKDYYKSKFPGKYWLYLVCRFSLVIYTMHIIFSSSTSLTVKQNIVMKWAHWRNFTAFGVCEVPPLFRRHVPCNVTTNELTLIYYE